MIIGLRLFLLYRNMVFCSGICCPPLGVTLFSAAIIWTCSRVVLAELTNSLFGVLINKKSIYLSLIKLMWLRNCCMSSIIVLPFLCLIWLTLFLVLSHYVLISHFYFRFYSRRNSLLFRRLYMPWSCPSVCLSVLRHIPVFCRDEWSYDHAVFTDR